MLNIACSAVEGLRAKQNNASGAALSCHPLQAIHSDPALSCNFRSGAMAHWPAMTRWKDLAYLKRVAGHRTVPVEASFAVSLPYYTVTALATFQEGGKVRSSAAVYMSESIRACLLQLVSFVLFASRRWRCKCWSGSIGGGKPLTILSRLAATTLPRDGGRG
jgi:hypothetical protein